MTAFTLKIIALVAMLIDHTGAVFPEYAPFEFRLIGRLTFPIFVYLIAEGFRYTRSPKKFLARLLAFAIISEPFYDWAINRTHNIRHDLSPWHIDFFSRTNIFYTLFLGGLAIFAFQQMHKTLPQVEESSPKERKEAYVFVGIVTALATLGLMLLADVLGTDYGGYGVLFILLMYLIKPKGPRLAVSAAMSILQHRWMFPYILSGALETRFYWFFPATLLAIPLIALYNSKRGPSMKWLFYIAYPAHLGVLAIIAYFI